MQIINTQLAVTNNHLKRERERSRYGWVVVSLVLDVDSLPVERSDG